MYSMSWLFGILFCALLGTVSLKPVEEVDSSEYGVRAGIKATNCSCGWLNKPVKRIVGGTGTEPHEYPMIAGIVYKATKILFCGSTLVTRRHIVTAAHCTTAFVEKPHEIGIHVGLNTYKDANSQKNLKDVEKVIVHEKYNPKLVKYDISMIMLKVALPVDPKIGPACLPSSRIPLVGQKLRVLGWGLTSNKGKQSDVLLKVDIEAKPFEDCMFTNLYMERFDVHQVCTFTKNKDSCSGDSGGPLLWRDPDTNRMTLAALVSYGSNCGHSTSVNSEVGYFLPWIQKQIADTDPNMSTCTAKA